MGGGGKKAPRATSLSPVPPTNVLISPENFLRFSLTLQSRWCKISRPYPVPVPNY